MTLYFKMLLTKFSKSKSQDKLLNRNKKVFKNKLRNFILQEKNGHMVTFQRKKLIQVFNIEVCIPNMLKTCKNKVKTLLNMVNLISKIFIDTIGKVVN